MVTESMLFGIVGPRDSLQQVLGAQSDEPECVGGTCRLSSSPTGDPEPDVPLDAHTTEVDDNALDVSGLVPAVAPEPGAALEPWHG